MADFLVLGTDTDAGKTTFALLWLAAFSDAADYWKPVETGASDSEQVRRLVPSAVVHPPVARFAAAVAPALAARREGTSVPPASAIAEARPSPCAPGRHVLIETFGSPLSPLTDDELQVELIRRLDVPSVLVASSALGAIGRTMQALHALAAHHLHPRAVVLVGAPDDFAAAQIVRHWPGVRVFALRFPSTWDADGVARSAREQLDTLSSVRTCLTQSAIRDSQSAILEADRSRVWHPYTSLGEIDAPLHVVGAQDEFLHLADGGRVIDAISSWWTVLHGHRFPPLIAALAEAMRTWDHVLFAGVTHGPAVELAALLLATAPWPGAGRVFYSDDGSTAVEVALKMAYQFWCQRGEPGRTGFVGFEHGYHGDTFGAMAVGRDPVFFGQFEPLLFRADRVPLSADHLDDVLTRRRGAVAAVIVEPLVQGAGGMRMHTPAELRALFEVTHRHEVLFIADEVMTGGGRTGTLWAHQAAGIAPDLICAGKTLAGGVLPLAATLVAPAVVAAFESSDPARTFFHGHSFTAHPLACAVAVANWRLLRDSDALAAPRRMEVFWREALAPLRDRATVRVCGSIAAAELGMPGGYLATVGKRLRRSCLADGLFLRPLGNVLYAMPPFCTSEASLQRIAAAMCRAVEELQPVRGGKTTVVDFGR
jgi:adenosylmethionine-8-amino-7-oxononanoate aminotransferase